MRLDKIPDPVVVPEWPRTSSYVLSEKVGHMRRCVYFSAADSMPRKFIAEQIVAARKQLREDIAAFHNGEDLE